MKQQPENTINGTVDANRFRQLVEWWSEHLGKHQVPVHEAAEDIHSFMMPDAVHHELIQDVVRRVYCANKCGHLGASITLEQTFTALGAIRHALMIAPDADVDQVNLLDEIGWHTRQYFNRPLDPSTRSGPDLHSEFLVEEERPLTLRHY